VQRNTTVADDPLLSASCAQLLLIATPEFWDICNWYCTKATTNAPHPTEALPALSAHADTWDSGTTMTVQHNLLSLTIRSFEKHFLLSALLMHTGILGRPAGIVQNRHRNV
jgi:hypothetical protein